MKAIIDKNGGLRIERAGKMKDTRCMCTMCSGYGTSRENCGDWCPAFREPYMHDRGENFTKSYRIQLCQQVGILYFDEIEDQRV